VLVRTTDLFNDGEALFKVRLVGYASKASSRRGTRSRNGRASEHGHAEEPTLLPLPECPGQCVELVEPLAEPGDVWLPAATPGPAVGV